MLPLLRFALPCAALLVAVMLIGGCGSQSPDNRLNHSLNELRDGIEARSEGRVMAVLHTDFQAALQASDALDRDWQLHRLTWE